MSPLVTKIPPKSYKKDGKSDFFRL